MGYYEGKEQSPGLLFVCRKGDVFCHSLEAGIAEKG